MSSGTTRHSGRGVINPCRRHLEQLLGCMGTAHLPLLLGICLALLQPQLGRGLLHRILRPCPACCSEHPLTVVSFVVKQRPALARGWCSQDVINAPACSDCSAPAKQCHLQGRAGAVEERALLQGRPLPANSAAASSCSPRQGAWRLLCSSCGCLLLPRLPLILQHQGGQLHNGVQESPGQTKHPTAHVKLLKLITCCALLALWKSSPCCPCCHLMVPCLPRGAAPGRVPGTCSASVVAAVRDSPGLWKDGPSCPVCRLSAGSVPLPPGCPEWPSPCFCRATQLCHPCRCCCSC